MKEETMGNLHKISLLHHGKVLEGEIAVPAKSGPHPAVLVIHNAFGIGPQVREAALQLAAEGYVALACDMYGDGFYSEDRATIAEVVKPLWQGNDLLRSRVNAWYEMLKTREDVDPGLIAALGYCFGGQCALELARSGADLTAAVSFHGLLSTMKPAERNVIKAYVTIYTGAKDPHVPAEHVARFRAEMADAGARWQVTEYGEARHAFTDIDANTPDEGREYNRLAHITSWRETLELLNFFVGDRRDH